MLWVLIKEKTINIETNDKINTKKKGITKVTKTKKGYELVINQDEITINQFINYITSKVTISNIDIEEDNIDNLIVKLYQDYNI